MIRREPESITIAGPAGDTHTYLYTELSDIQYGAAGTPVAAAEIKGDTQAQTGGNTPPANQATHAEATIVFPQGAALPVASNGLLDSGFVPIGALALGTMDSDVKSPEGKVLIPAGANVSFLVRDKKVVSDQIQMEFELASADFNGRHYMISSVKGGSEPGAVVTFTGAKAGSPEAKLRGENIHLDDHALMVFKAETPTVFRVSQ